jgi:hypothetical protein
MKRHVWSLAFAAAVLLLPFAAGAQGVPSYARPAAGADEHIQGRVANFDGGYRLLVRDERGYLDDVRLHPGTIINPTGLTLAPGMIVSILGYNAGSFFSANEIDTPYTFVYGVPYFAGHVWTYYGPAYSLGFFFGHPGWWHGTAFGGPHRFVGGVRFYDGFDAGSIYHGGAFHGRDYVAPHDHGGYSGPGTPERRYPSSGGDRSHGY